MANGGRLRGDDEQQVYYTLNSAKTFIGSDTADGRTWLQNWFSVTGAASL